MSIDDRERWNRRWEERRGDGPGGPSPLIESLDGVLPRSGRALDVAGGAGRHALWLARRGLAVTLADVSPVALEIAGAAAAAVGLVIQPVLVDLGQDSPPAGPWDLVLDVHYLERPLIPALARELAPGGTLVVLHPTVRNLERHPSPSRRFLLEEGELLRLLEDQDDLRVVHHQEGWLGEGRHEALGVAIRIP